MRVTRRELLLAGAGLALARPALAQAWPARPIRLIVPFPPGGITDIVARAVARGMGESLGQQVVIDNRPGAGGRVALQQARNTAPDGYTLFVINGATHGIVPAIERDVGYDAVNDFASIMWMAETPVALVVPPTVQARSVADLVALIRANPGRINYSSSGIGSGAHFSGIMMMRQAGLPMDAAVHVPYRGDQPALTALLSGEAQFSFLGGAAKALVDEGRLVALGTTGRERWFQLPNVPTMIEQGFEGFYIPGWSAIAAPAGTPAEILERANAAGNASLRQAETQRVLRDAGFSPRGGSREELRHWIGLEVTRWKRLVEENGLRFE